MIPYSFAVQNYAQRPNFANLLCFFRHFCKKICSTETKSLHLRIKMCES